MTTYDRKPKQERPRQPAPAPVKNAAKPAPAAAIGGPLTRTARKGGGPETNWGEVAQQVTVQYHALGGKVTQADLLGALRQFPGGGPREDLIKNLGGTHAESLREALNADALAPDQKGPTPLSPLKVVNRSSATPDSKTRTPTAAPKAAGAGAKAAARPEAVPEAKKQPQASAAAPSPKLKLNTPRTGDAKSARTPAPDTAKTPTRAPLKLRGNATTAVATSGTRESGQATGGKEASGGNLIVARRDTFKGLNVNLKPSMERGGKLVFSPGAWRAAEQGARKALLRQQKALHARKVQGSLGVGTPAQPFAAPTREGAAQQAKIPRVPSHTIRAAEIKRHQQQNRQKNQAKLKTVVGRANKAATAIAKVQPKAKAKITAAQKSAEAQVTAALSKTLGQIRSAEAGARSLVTSRATAATARVTAAHQSTVQGIRQDTTQKISELKKSAQALKTQFTATKTRLDADVTAKFNTTRTTIVGIGNSKAGSARATGQQFAAQYRAEPLPQQNALQELANGSDYYAKKRDAKVQAALDVSGQYGTEMTKAGNEQGGKIMESLPQALASNSKVLDEYNTQLQTFLDGQVSGLQTLQTQAINQANQQRSTLISQINQQRAQALSRIGRAAAQGRTQATNQANSKKQSIRTQGQQAVKGVNTGVKAAQAQMKNRVQAFQKDAQGKMTLDAPEFAKMIGGFEKYAQQGGTQAQAQVTRSATASAARLKASGAPAARALSALGQSTATSLKSQGTQTGTSLTALGSGGAAAMKQALTGHQRTTKAAFSSASKQFKSFGEGFTKDGEQILKDVGEQLDKTHDPFTAALGDALGKEPGDIEAAASKAADSVQPRWKGILKVVIDVVIVVATIAATVALAAVLGPAALVLAGMAIGALGAVAGQGLKDVVDGKFSGWGAYGAAALGGAIGGAFGGAGGAVGNILARGAMKGVTSGLAKGAMRVGVEGAVGTGFDLAGQVATGYANQAIFKTPYKLSDTFNVKNVAMTGVMNTAGTALASPSVVKFVGNKLGSINIPGKGLIGNFQNTLKNSRPIQAINKLDSKITSSKLFTGASGKLERAGELFGTKVGQGGQAIRSGAVKTGSFAKTQAGNVKGWTEQKVTQTRNKAHDFAAWSQGQLNDAGRYLKGRPDAMKDWLKANGKDKLKATVKETVIGAGKKAGINQISEYLFDGKWGNFKDISRDAVEGGVSGGMKEGFKGADAPEGSPPANKWQNSRKVAKDSLVGAGSGVVSKFINNLMLTGRIGSRAEYLIAAVEGGMKGAGGKMADLSSTALLKAVVKENTNRYVKVFAKFASDSGLKSVFDFGMQNLANITNSNVFGSAYTWKNLLSGKEVFKVVMSGAKFGNLAKELTPLLKTDLKRAGTALSDWKTQQWNNLKQHLNTLGTKAGGKLNDIKDYAGGKYDAARTRLADFTGSHEAPVRMQENPDLLPGEARVVGHGEGSTTVEFGPNTSDAVKKAHTTTARDLRAANGLPRKLSDRLQEIRGRTPTKGGTEKLRLEAEASKHRELASAYREAAETFPQGSVQRQHYEEQAALAEHYATEYKAHSARTDPTLPDTKGSVETRLQSGRKEAMKRGYPEAPEGYQWAFYETGDLKLVKLNTNSPTMDYIPGKNGQPGEFKIIDEATTPAKKGQSSTQKWDTERLVTDENGQVVALKQKMDDWLQRRADAQKEVDRMKRLGENLTPEQIAELKAFEQQVREQSRIIGEEAGKNYMASRFPDGNAEMIYPRDGVSHSRSGDFDQVWQVKDKQGNLQIIVIEAKGGTSSLGRRRSDKGPGSQYVEQGSREYFDTIVSEMVRGKNDDMRSAGREVRNAARTGDVEYLEVRAPIESKIVNLPDGTTEFTNTALDIKITPFILTE